MPRRRPRPIPSFPTFMPSWPLPTDIWEVRGLLAALDQLLQRMSGLTASDPRLDRPFARAADRERFLEALRNPSETDRGRPLARRAGRNARR